MQLVRSRWAPRIQYLSAELISFKLIMYQLKVDVDKLNAVKVVVNGVKLIYINLKLIHYTFILYADAD